MQKRQPDEAKLDLAGVMALASYGEAGPLAATQDTPSANREGCLVGLGFAYAFIVGVGLNLSCLLFNLGAQFVGRGSSLVYGLAGIGSGGISSFTHPVGGAGSIARGGIGRGLGGVLGLFGTGNQTKTGDSGQSKDCGFAHGISPRFCKFHNSFENFTASLGEVDING